MCDDDIYLSYDSLPKIADEIWIQLIHIPCNTKYVNVFMPIIKTGRTRKTHVNGYCQWLTPPIITIRNPVPHSGYFSLKTLIHELTHARGFTHGKVLGLAFLHTLCIDDWSTEVISRLLRNGRIEVIG